MTSEDKIKFYIEQANSIISDIDNSVDKDSISIQYSELKNNIHKEIKSFNYENATNYEKSILFPALEEFFNLLKARRGSKNTKTIQTSLIDGVDKLEWFKYQSK